MFLLLFVGVAGAIRGFFGSGLAGCIADWPGWAGWAGLLGMIFNGFGKPGA